MKTQQETQTKVPTKRNQQRTLPEEPWRLCEQKDTTSEILVRCLAQDESALGYFTVLQASRDISHVVGNKAYNTLAYLRKNEATVLDACMLFLVLDITSSFAGPYKSSNNHVNSIVEAIKAKYYYFTLEELLYVFGQAKNSTYGNANFSGIDQPQIMRWLEAYDLGERLQIIESKRKVIVKKELSELEIKELQSLVPFDVVQSMYPECTEKDYLEASIADLQKLFLPTVMASKAKECGVSYEEYLLIFPKATPKNYLSKDSYELKLEFEKAHEAFWQNAVKDLNTYGFPPQSRNIMAYLAKLISKDYEKYKKELSRLVEKLESERAKRRKKYRQHQKNKCSRQKKSRFRYLAYQ